MTNPGIQNPIVRYQLAEFLASQHRMLNRTINAFRIIDQPSSATDAWIKIVRNEHMSLCFGARCMARRLDSLIPEPEGEP